MRGQGLITGVDGGFCPRAGSGGSPQAVEEVHAPVGCPHQQAVTCPEALATRCDAGQALVGHDDRRLEAAVVRGISQSVQQGAGHCF